EGNIGIWDACLSPERTNKSPTQNLILDAAREMDEGRRDKAEQGDNASSLFFSDADAEEIRMSALDEEID
ncbi:MAG TPA: hypothetical protein PKD58_03475, partial [Candidatus Sumerlaeota bacterium]|nr:hypothetical protein [Candidatus Sumerlaeota bacterium]